MMQELQEQIVPELEAGETAIKSDSRLVVVRRQWNDWREAKYRFDQLEDPHWSYTCGGICVPAPRAFIHAYVICTAMVEGELAHSGTHGSCPHRIKVCVVKKANAKDVFADLKAIADTKCVR